MERFFDWFEHVYPYTNFHELNLDWCINTVKMLAETMRTFVTLNTIKYADPIQWNITKQYEKNTVVVEPLSGTAYISTQAVPSGVGINNTDYWSVVFTLDVVSANKNITLRDDANNMLATFESVIGDWVLWNGTLYVVTRNIEIGQAYVIDYNIERATVELFIKLYIDELTDYVNGLVGSLDDLTTTDKDNIVSAINWIKSNTDSIIGSLSDLTTTDKDNIVDAINEVVGTLSNIMDSIGALQDLNTVDKDNIVSAINWVKSNTDSIIGSLSDLTTTDKDNIVDAINEVVGTLENLETFPRTLEGKQIALYGDSWSDPNQSSYIPWVNRLSAIAGVTVHNVSDSGRTMSQIASAFDYYNADVYIIEGGINDWNQDITPTIFYNAINSIVTKIKSVNADAEIIFITPPAWCTHSPNYPSITSHYPLEMYRQIIWQQAEELGYMVASGLNMSLLNKGDGLHPSATSITKLADYINICYLKNGDTRDFCNEFVATQNSSGFIVASGGNFYWRFVKDLTFDNNGEATFNDNLINSGSCLIIEPGVCSFARLGSYGFIVYPELTASGLTVTCYQMSTGQKATGTVNNVCIHIPLMINYTTKMGIAN